MKKVFVLAIVALMGATSCQLPDTGGKVPAFDQMAAQTQTNLDSATNKVVKRVKDSSGTLLQRLNQDSVTIEIGNTGEKFTLKN